MGSSTMACQFPSHVTDSKNAIKRAFRFINDSARDTIPLQSMERKAPAYKQPHFKPLRYRTLFAKG